MFKVCVSDGGDVAGVSVIKGTGKPALDERWMNTIKTWRYKPYEIKGEHGAVLLSAPSDGRIQGLNRRSSRRAW